MEWDRILWKYYIINCLYSCFLNSKEICYVLKLTIQYLLVIIRTFITNIKSRILVKFYWYSWGCKGLYDFFNSNNSIMISVKVVGMVVFIWNIQFKSHTVRSIQNPWCMPVHFWIICVTTSVVVLRYFQNYVAISHHCASLERVFRIHPVSPLGRYWHSGIYVMFIG